MIQAVQGVGDAVMGLTHPESSSIALQTAIITLLGGISAILGHLIPKQISKYRFTNGNDRRGGIRIDEVNRRLDDYILSHDKQVRVEIERVNDGMAVLHEGQDRIEQWLVRFDERFDRIVRQP